MTSSGTTQRASSATASNLSPMPRGGAVAIYAATFLVALVLRVAYAHTRPVPVTADAAYYLHVAENLAAGRGFVADYVWHYLAGIPRELPVPSNSYWMPGTSIAFAGAFRIAGQTGLRVAQWLSLLFGALLCPLAAWIASRITGRREAALLAGAAAAVNYYLVELSLVPGQFMLYAVLVNSSLLALWAAWRGVPSLAAVAGAVAGLAYLTRADGALLLVVALLLAVFFRRHERRSHSLRLVVIFGITFAVVASPWWVRQTLVFGSPSGASPLRTAFLANYDDLFRVDQSGLTPAALLEQGPVLLAGIRAYALYRSLRVLAKSLLLLAPLALAGLWLRRTRQEATPWVIYCGLGLFVPAALFPYPALKGTSWHLLPALLPGLQALAVAALLRLVDVARPRRIAWLAWSFAVASVLSPCYFWLRPPAGAGDASGSLYPLVADQAVGALGGDAAPALTDSCWGLNHVAHIPCAQFPSDGVEAALLVADAVGARYVITRSDETHTRPALPYMQGISNHPRFQPAARYRDEQGSLLVYRILPPAR